MTLFSRAFIRKRMISLAATASVTVTSLAIARAPTRADHPHRTIPIQYIADRPNRSDQQPFLSENAAIAKEMIADMAIAPIGDVGRDFVATGVPHHQAAIDVAKAELKYGHNERLRRLAQEIVANQQHYIAAIRDARIDGSSARSE
jgi:uncharacterized protein (DUF305 family)